MPKRIAIVDKKKCNPVGCGGYLCMKVCPVNRQGEPCIAKDFDNKVKIDEKLCIGCHICVKKCPFDAIKIVNLPEALSKEPIFRYGENKFALYNLPTPIFGKVTGIIGRNGIGKTTAIQLLAGIIKPNLGQNKQATQQEIINYFKGTEAHSFFEKAEKGDIKISYKPQQVDQIPKQYNGTVRQLLEKADEKNALNETAKKLDIEKILDHDIKNISGGELQRVAIAAAVLKKANVYFFDEPTSYLDIKQRLNVAKYIKELANENTAVMVIEHDLIILDYLSDMTYIMYGQESVYGVVSQVKTTKSGINIYLSGYLKEENIRFRDKAITFENKTAERKQEHSILTEWEAFQEKLGKFTIKAEKGEITQNTIVGILGENGIGKTTFVKILAGEIKDHKLKTKIAYKPQYLEPTDELVMNVLQKAKEKYQNQLITPLKLEQLFQRQLDELSGGELQRVAIAECLSQDADLFLLDEPSAYLDVEQRLSLSKLIKDILYITGKSALIVDHDLLFTDYLADKLIVFEGEPAVHGEVKGPFSMEQGMNMLLKEFQITFRRDEENQRPRANKPGSQKDQEQKKSGKLYYV